ETAGCEYNSGRRAQPRIPTQEVFRRTWKPNATDSFQHRPVLLGGDNAKKAVALGFLVRRNTSCVGIRGCARRPLLYSHPAVSRFAARENLGRRQRCAKWRTAVQRDYGLGLAGSRIP